MPKPDVVDLERCLAATIKQDNGCQSLSSPKASRHCAIAIQHLDGRALLIDALIEEEDGYFIFSSAKKQFFRAVSNRWHQRLVGKLFLGLDVGTATVKQIMYPAPRPHSPEPPPTLPSRIHLQAFTPDSLLTQALHTPGLPLHAATFLPNLSVWALAHHHHHHRSETTFNEKTDDDGGESIRTCVEQQQQDDDHEVAVVVVVRRVIDRAKVAWLLVLLLLVSPAFGILVGVCSRSADVGIAVSAGIFALASFVQGLVVWVQG